MTTILNNSNLQINGKTIRYEGNIKFKPGGATRTPYVQNNGEIIIVTDNSTNYSILKVTIRNSKEIDAIFDLRVTEPYPNNLNSMLVPVMPQPFYQTH
jgi:outer membrane lipoprotein-sorting protein